MDPITGAKFSDDFRKFVLQEGEIQPLINPNAKPVKPFKLEPNEETKKAKKDLKKDKNKK